MSDETLVARILLRNKLRSKTRATSVSSDMGLTNETTNKHMQPKTIHRRRMADDAISPLTGPAQGHLILTAHA